MERLIRLRSIRLAIYAFTFQTVVLVVRTITLALRLARASSLARQLRKGRRRRRVLYLSAFFPGNAGHDQRIEGWASVLRRRGFDVDVRWAMDADRFRDLTARTDLTAFQIAFLRKRLGQCLGAVRCDAVIVHRELLTYNDYGGLFLERFLLALNENVALDFDDDLGASKGEPRPTTPYGSLMSEARAKFRDSLRLYPSFVAGSRYLAGLIADEEASRHVPADVVVVPTCIALDSYPMKSYSPATDELTFGWIGTVGNLEQIDAALPALEDLERTLPVRLVVISGTPYSRPTSVTITNVAWSREGFLSALVDVDVGLMPLRDDRAGRGKCGYKLLQYMACGIVGVASAVTTNTEILEDGVNGFLVSAEEGWPCAIERVVASRELFPAIGRKGRDTVAARYTFDANEPMYAQFIDRLTSGRRPAYPSR